MNKCFYEINNYNDECSTNCKLSINLLNVEFNIPQINLSSINLIPLYSNSNNIIFNNIKYNLTNVTITKGNKEFIQYGNIPVDGMINITFVTSNKHVNSLSIYIPIVLGKTTNKELNKMLNDKKIININNLIKKNTSYYYFKKK